MSGYTQANIKEEKKEKRKKKPPQPSFFNDFIVSLEVEKLTPEAPESTSTPVETSSCQTEPPARVGTGKLKDEKRKRRKKGARWRLQGEQHEK